MAFEFKDPMKVFLIVSGPLIWLGDKGESAGYFEVFNYIDMCKAHYDKLGVGAAFIESLFR